MKLPLFLKFLLSISFFCASAAIASPGQSIRAVVNFNAANGGDPNGPLVQGTDGNLYGTTFFGGANNGGTVYRITPNGTLTTLYSFCAQTNCTDGDGPVAGLMLATDGNLYGTTRYGGSFGLGTVFRTTPEGSLTILFSFDSIHGANPEASLVQGTDGALYGTTATGGTTGGRGTVFRITLSGTLTRLYSFGSNRSDGANPLTPVVLGSDGNLYGTTTYGGNFACTDGCGTVFMVTPTGTFTTLHRFNMADGESPEGALIQASDGNFYGTTFRGGANNLGTVFKISSVGTLTILHTFDSTGGVNPVGGLIEGTDKNLYGTTGYGGTRSAGTVFTISTGGTLTTLGNLGYITTGATPISAMVQDTDGNFYGEGYYGGSGGYGTLFGVSTGLGQFVTTLPTFGKVGAPVKILGTNLTSATSVAFNGTPATFTVMSRSFIKTTVPTGATAGSVQVTTSSGTLTSNVVFRVQ
ncbi:MAG: hypothetical protein LAN63_08650 [Acidobacteriia bacterium]|nr:hypothetical protein [Terriglobia bacterium]